MATDYLLNATLIVTAMIVILILVFLDTFLVRSLSLYAHQLLREHTLMF